MPKMLFFLLISVKMPTFMGGKNFMLSLVEHEFFITSGPVLYALEAAF